MKLNIFHTNENLGTVTVRIVLGIVIFSHGAQAMLGWFGGAGMSATIDSLMSFAGLPWIIALSVICVQFFGSVMLLAGFATRIAALAIFGMFAGMVTYHVDHGFHMNWTGSKTGEGFEYHVLVLAMCIVLLINGGGALSIDRMIGKRIRQ